MSTLAHQATESKPNPRRVLLGWSVKSFFGLLITGLILFWSAGSITWLWGWVYLASFAAVTIITPFVADADLLAQERGKGKANTKSWDRVVFGLYGLFSTLGTMVVAGLDQRWGWSSAISGGLSVPLAVQIIALVVYLLGWALHLWAMAENRFFARSVRLQEDRGQRVIDSGPYRWVRHPGYVGGLAYNIGSPLILASWWALIPGLIAAGLLVLRTALEDRTLLTELPGYQEFSQKTPYLLIPGIW